MDAFIRCPRVEMLVRHPTNATGLLVCLVQRLVRMDVFSLTTHVTRRVVFYQQNATSVTGNRAPSVPPQVIQDVSIRLHLVIPSVKATSVTGLPVFRVPRGRPGAPTQPRLVDQAARHPPQHTSVPERHVRHVMQERHAPTQTRIAKARARYPMATSVWGRLARHAPPTKQHASTRWLDVVAGVHRRHLLQQPSS